MKLPSCFCIFTLAVLLGCSQQSGSSSSVDSNTTAGGTGRLEPVTLMLNWYPEAEHGGYYAALVHGYYEDAGLDVTIIPGGRNAPVVQQAARGAVDFGVTNADRIVTAAAQGATLRAIFAPLSNSPRCLLVHEESGIEDFDQLENVTMMLSREHAWAQYLIKRLPLHGVEIVPNSASLAPFLADPRSAKQAYVISEPFVATSEGAKVRSLLVADVGFNPYTSVLMTRNDAIRQRPDFVQRVIDASRRGWQKYLADSTETNEFIQTLNPEMSLDILEFGTDALNEHCVENVEAADFGSMNNERWATLVSQLEELEMIEPDAVDPRKMFQVE